MKERAKKDPKLCPKCKKFFPRSSYAVRRKRLGGIDSYCKTCTSVKRKATVDRTNFGGNREVAIQRDGEKCVNCHMTRSEHKIRYGYDITVDHIDRKGLGVPKHQKNNSLENLQTLCIECHARKDNISLKVKLTREQVEHIRTLKGTTTRQSVANEYGISPHTVRNIWHRPHYHGVTFTEHIYRPRNKNKLSHIKEMI